MAKRKLAKVSITELQAEIARRSRQSRTLIRRRDRLVTQLADLDEQIREAGAIIGSLGGVRRRPRNETNLEEALIKLLKNKTLGVTVIAEKVQTAGYKTSSANFRTIVNQALISSKAFKRVSRGQYTVSARYKK